MIVYSNEPTFNYYAANRRGSPYRFLSVIDTDWYTGKPEIVPLGRDRLGLARQGLRVVL